MKKLLFLLIIPFLNFGQISCLIPSDSNNPTLNENLMGCQDLDETILNILSLFMNDPEFGFFGCADIIPYLESQALIPLDCNTNLTPFGYFNMSVSDVCECSCQEYLNLNNFSPIPRKLINTYSILGQESSQINFQLHLYDDGSIEKKYLINTKTTPQ